MSLNRNCAVAGHPHRDCRPDKGWLSGTKIGKHIWSSEGITAYPDGWSSHSRHPAV